MDGLYIIIGSIVFIVAIVSIARLLRRIERLEEQLSTRASELHVDRVEARVWKLWHEKEALIAHLGLVYDEQPARFGFKKK